MNDSGQVSFELNLDSLAGDSSVQGLVDGMRRLPVIDSQAAFNDVCREVCSLWRTHFPRGRGTTTSDYERLNSKIAGNSSRDGVIPTSWGGVVVLRHKHPEVEKFLVVRQGAYLALEKHAEKDEYLEVKEGAGILLWRDTGAKCLSVHELRSGDTYRIQPCEEHCIIGTEDLLISESSVDPLGMDQDLLFIYTPEES